MLLVTPMVERKRRFFNYYWRHHYIVIIMPSLVYMPVCVCTFSTFYNVLTTRNSYNNIVFLYIILLHATLLLLWFDFFLSRYASIKN